MKYDDGHVKRTAKRFLDSWHTRIWYYVTSDVRRALLDSFMMDELRLGYDYDEDGKPTGFNSGDPHTAAEHWSAFLAFRDRVARALSLGVARGSRSPKVSYSIEV